MTNSEARKRITGTTSDWHTCDRAEQAEATIARIKALADEWATTEIADEWEAADRWADAAHQLRAALEDQP